MKKHTTVMGMHSVRNLLGEQKQISLFSDHDKQFSEEYGYPLDGPIDRFGVHLSDIEARVMEGILHGFTETNYQGNLEPKTKQELAAEKYAGVIPDSYRYVKEIPRIKVSQSQLLKWAGIKTGSIAEKERSVAALKELGQKQFCFYYDRLAYDADGKPIKDQKGYWKKEEVISVDTLFLIKEVREDANNRLSYYEITPSSLFLDQRESYFLLMPLGWRDEVYSVFGRKRASSYTFRFLLFLRYQYEKRRRSPEQKSPYSLKWTPEEIAIAIKMPESVYKRRKKRANEILQDAYFVAKELGYLTDYDRGSTVDILFFKDEKYYTHHSNAAFIKTHIEEEKDQFSEESKKLFDEFHRAILAIDDCHVFPEGIERKQQLKVFQGLISRRSFEDVVQAFNWALNRPYWCSKILVPKQFKDHFQAIWTEMKVSLQSSPEGRVEKHRQLAQKLVKLAYSKDKHLRIESCNDHLSISYTNHPHAICFDFNDSNFVSKVRKECEKRKILFRE